MGRGTTLLLLGVSLISGLSPPKFLVDFRTLQKKKEHYPSITLRNELYSLISGATPLISKEALRYLHHEVLDDDSPVQVNTNDESGSVNVHASTILGGGAAISMAKGAAGIGVAAAGGAALMEY